MDIQFASDPLKPDKSVISHCLWLREQTWWRSVSNQSKRKKKLDKQDLGVFASVSLSLFLLLCLGVSSAFITQRFKKRVVSLSEEATDRTLEYWAQCMCTFVCVCVCSGYDFTSCVLIKLMIAIWPANSFFLYSCLFIYLLIYFFSILPERACSSAPCLTF